MDRVTFNCSKGKRKSAGEAAADHYHGIVPPRYISCKMIRQTVSPPCPATPWAEPARASYVSLPHELFCNIVAYLGPTCSSLSTLSQVNRDHNAIMKTIGDVMLQQATLRFRVPLPARSWEESSISLFVRHARVSKSVHDKLEVLDQVLRKDFPIVMISSRDDAAKDPFELLSIQNLDPGWAPNNGILVAPSEVNHALNIALCLMGCWKQQYFDDPHEARNIAENAATTALEWRVTSLCSVLGAKAYKYAKSRMCRRNQHEDELFSAYTTVTDEMPLEEDDSDFDDDDDVSIDSSDFDDDEDMTILDKASLVMQHVVLRKQQTARQNVHSTTAAMAPKRVPRSILH